MHRLPILARAAAWLVAAAAVAASGTAAAQPLAQAYCTSTSNLNRVALGEQAMRFDCPGVAARPLSAAALGRLGWRVQAAIAFGAQTMSPRAGIFIERGR